MPLDLERQIEALRAFPEIGQHLADALVKIQASTNQLGGHLGVDSTGNVPPPAPVQKLEVQTDGQGLIDASITDHNALHRNIQYFLEYDTDPNFTKPKVKHLGAGRHHSVVLPDKDALGNPQQFYFRAYSQYLGGGPSKPIAFGGETPAPVAPGGAHQLTLLPSTGSGTAQTSGEEGGSGLGKVLFRPATDVKRPARL